MTYRQCIPPLLWREPTRFEGTRSSVTDFFLFFFNVSTFQRFNVLTFFLLLLATTACRSATSAPSLERFTFTSPHMGTLFTITLYTTNKASAETAAAAAFHRVAALDEVMSDYRADS